MEFMKNATPYLGGDDFSKGYAFRFELDKDDLIYRSRNEILIEQCRDKKIIHLGCVDHNIKIISEKLARSKWLHAELVAVAEHCLGVDINAKGIDYISNTIGIRDVIALDIVHDECSVITSRKWDILLIPDVLEHINDPVAFLSEIRRKFDKCISTVIITVPNAFALQNFSYSRRNIECINTDHRYLFSPYTLAKVATEAGFKIDKFLMCNSGVVKKHQFLKNYAYSRRPLTRNSIVMFLNP